VRGYFGFVEANSQILSAKINHEIMVLSGVVTFTVLFFCVFISINHFKSKKIKEKSLPLIADQSGKSHPERGDPNDPMLMEFVKDLIASAQSKSVPLAPLQTLLAKLIDAGVSDAEIPNRLLVAAEQLEALRASLANWHDGGPGHEQICSEALACVDSGDFYSASEVLRRGREARWMFPMATCHEEAEFYAREAMIDHMQLQFCAAAEKYANAGALVADAGGNDAWRFLIAKARELCEDGREFGTRENMLLAIEIYHRALGLVGREQSPLDWAETKLNLGDALLLLGESNKDSKPLREAVEAYLAALEEWTLDRAPLDWAKAQNHLGNALQRLGEQENDPERLRQAAEAYRAALAECTKENAPFERAQACNRLGDILAVLGVEEGDGERLKEAVKAYREALDGVDRKLAPLDWAMTQNNLGKALEALGESETGTGTGTGLLHQAVAAYQAALEERCRDLAPSSWATTNANLGNALVEIAERENNNAMLEDAASAYRDALKARPAEDSPFDTAKININLAYTLGALWNRTRDRQVLDEALDAVEAALGLIKQIGVREHIPAAELTSETILAAMGHRAAKAAAA
jgi:tetratricopeptide (TPR) repeat protein